MIYLNCCLLFGCYRFLYDNKNVFFIFIGDLILFFKVGIIRVYNYFLIRVKEFIIIFR